MKQRNLNLTVKEVKELLVSVGFNPKGFRVKVQHGIDTEISVYVTDPTINKKNMQEFLDFNYHVQRVDALGLELKGCNQYVDIY